jgi:hypothetical protein
MAMKLQQDEKINKVYHHHKIFFFIRGIKIWMASLPFFLLTYIFSFIMPSWLDWTVGTSVVAIFALIQVYDSLMYYLDTLIISNQRLVHLDWINLFKYREIQASLDDIQHIESSENGFLSKLKMFDYGLFLVETASTKTVISFPEAPDPEEIKFFLINLSRKHLGLEQEEANSPVVKEEFTISEKTEMPASKVASPK